MLIKQSGLIQVNVTTLRNLILTIALAIASLVSNDFSIEHKPDALSRIFYFEERNASTLAPICRNVPDNPASICRNVPNYPALHGSTPFRSYKEIAVNSDKIQRVSNDRELFISSRVVFMMIDTD